MGNSFTRKARLAYYLAWIPMAALIGLLLHFKGLPLLVTMAATLILAVPYALICGSTYFMCRAMPLRRSRVSQVIPSLAGASILASAVWLGLVYCIGYFTSWFPAHLQYGLYWLFFGLGMAYFALSLAFHYLVIAIEEIRQAEKHADEAKVLTREAELKALRAQLNPHFLFNSLNSIAALTAVDPRGAREMVLLLSTFFRNTLTLGKRDRVTLAEEIGLTRSYLDIEKVRFSDRMSVVEEIEEACLTLEIPPLLLQPLVENAVKHGVAQKLESSVIRLQVENRGHLVSVEVSNDFEPSAKQPNEGGHGIRTTEERLGLFYGGESSMVVKKNQGIFAVTLMLPKMDNQ